MCYEEAFGSFHRACEHFVVAYRTGIIRDCMSPKCENSSQHPRTCYHPYCVKRGVYADDHRLINYIQGYCDDCIAKDPRKRPKPLRRGYYEDDDER